MSRQTSASGRITHFRILNLIFDAFADVVFSTDTVTGCDYKLGVDQ